MAVADIVCPHANSINFGTGEFCFNPNTLALARYIHAKYPQVKLAITSNGASILLISDKELKELFSDIDVSVDFANPEEHNDFRQHPQAWNWVLKSLQKMKRLGIPRSIVTCVTSLTTNNHIEQLLLLAKEYNASWRTNWFRHTGRGEEHLRLSSKRFWEIIKYLIDKGLTFECLSDPLLASLLGHPEKNPVAGCACGTLSCRIQTDLKVTPCVYLKGDNWVGGNILQDGLSVIYQHPHFIDLRERKLPALCRQCQYIATCRGGCASRAVLHSGGLDQPDDFCPFIGGDKEAVEAFLQDLRKRIRVVQSHGLVHDGYLCTMIVNQREIEKSWLARPIANSLINIRSFFTNRKPRLT
jgi:radical SAM protein with 4Fe4S-binding SPASM domain